MNRLIILCLLFFIFNSCNKVVPKADKTIVQSVTETSKLKKPQAIYQDFFNKNPKYISDGFDFPVGKPDAEGYYNAQPFQQNAHLGDDWNVPSTRIHINTKFYNI